MKLALRELRRRPGKFVTATLILTLIAILLMFLGGLLDGLIRSRHRRGQGPGRPTRSSTRSRRRRRSCGAASSRTSATEIEALPGVDEVGWSRRRAARRHASRATARATWPTSPCGATRSAPTGVPEPPPPGEAWADVVLRADGVEVGDELLVGPARTPIVVAGWVEDTSYNGQGGLWADVDTWRKVLVENRPGRGARRRRVPGARRPRRRFDRRRHVDRRRLRLRRRGAVDPRLRSMRSRASPSSRRRSTRSSV